MTASKSFLSRWQRSFWARMVSACTCLLLFNALAAATAPLPPADKPAYYPGWWFTQGLIQPSPSAGNPPSWVNGDYPPTDDFAVANVGQLKQIATKAAAELNANLPGGAGDTVNGLIAQWTSPPGNGVTRDDFAALTLGQLKSVAQPFYDQLIAAHYTTAYPWVNNAADDYAVANVGQLKFLFSFDLTYTASEMACPIGGQSRRESTRMTPAQPLHRRRIQPS